VAWVDPEHHLAHAAGRAEAMHRSAHALAARHPARFRLVGNGPAFRAARADGAIAGVLGIEGGHALEERLETLERFFRGGLRVLTLVWNNHLSWVRSCQDGAGAGVPAGLSAFGREVVRHMNALGIVVDLAHAGRRSFHDAVEESTRPVLASHVGCSALHDHPRNLDDDQLRALAANGGVAGIVFHPGFLAAEARAEQGRVRASAAWRALQAENPTALFLEQQRVMRRDMRPYPIEGLVAHVLHAIEVAGIEHVGIGSDFDGIECGPAGLEDAACYGVLAEHLLARGLTLAELDMVLGRNVERVFAACTGPGTEADSAAIEPPALGGAPDDSHSG